jgi:hypothetical protein
LQIYATLSTAVALTHSLLVPQGNLLLAGLGWPYFARHFKREVRALFEFEMPESTGTQPRDVKAHPRAVRRATRARVAHTTPAGCTGMVRSSVKDDSHSVSEDVIDPAVLIAWRRLCSHAADVGGRASARRAVTQISF